MPNFVFMDNSLSLFKKLQNNRMLSFYVAADAGGSKVGMTMNKARNIKQDSAKAKGKTLRKELGVNKFCRGLVVKDGDGKVHIVNLGGSISNGLLKKLLKKLAEEAAGSQKANLLKAVNSGLTDKSYLETLKANEGMALDDAGGGDDSSGGAPESFSDALSALEDEFVNPRDILAEEMEIMAEARKAYLEAKESGEGLVEAAAQLAGALDTGSNIFDNSEESEALAMVYQTLITERFIDPDGAVEYGDELRRIPFTGARILALNFLDLSVPIQVCISFDAESDGGKPAWQEPDGALHEEYGGTDLKTWCEGLVTAGEKRLKNTFTTYEANLKAGTGSMTAAQFLFDAMNGHKEWLKAQIKAALTTDLTPMVNISELTYKQLLPAAGAVISMFQTFQVEANSAEMMMATVPPPPDDFPIETDDSWSETDLNFLEEMGAIQQMHLERIFAMSDDTGSFKFQLAPAGFPDLLRYAGWARPRTIGSTSFSEFLVETGYSEKNTGSYLFEGNTLVFSLKKDNPMIAARIRGVLAQYGNAARYIGTSLKEYQAILDTSLLEKTFGKDGRKTRKEALKEKLEESTKAEIKRIVDLCKEENEGKSPYDPTLVSAPVKYIEVYADLFFKFCCDELSDESFVFVVATHPKLARLRGSYSELAPMLGLSGVARVLWIYDHFIHTSADRQVNVAYSNRKVLDAKVDIHRKMLDPDYTAEEGITESTLTDSVLAEIGPCITDIVSMMKDIVTRFDRKLQDTGLS